MKTTAEAVSRSHPDKICDQISDAILDCCLKDDPLTRAGIEVMGGHGLILITGELTTSAKLVKEDFKKIAEDIYRDCGYKDPVRIGANISKQSPEIKKGVDNEGAGDQGIMVGYATNETSEMMPLEISLARKLVRSMGRHDGKAQVTIKDGRVVNFLTSLCNSGDMSDVTLEETIEKEIMPLADSAVNPVRSSRGALNPAFAKKTEWHLSPRLTEEYSASNGVKETNNIWIKNPNGEWLIGGFASDAGLTGRKIVADAYGPRVPVGGGAFSGKDATKVDRSAAYMARKIAVDYVKKGAKEAKVFISYAIGLAEPLSAVAIIDGKEEEIAGYDLRPRAIIDFLDLKKPQFLETAKYGHFGNGFTWDK